MFFHRAAALATRAAGAAAATPTPLVRALSACAATRAVRGMDYRDALELDGQLHEDERLIRNQACA